MIKVNPIKLSGNWAEGYALDIHTISSIMLGYDEYGHEVFDTKRSEIGELLYKLKYKSDKTTADAILDVVISFLENDWKIAKVLAGIVPVPPSKTGRVFQPLTEIAKSISSRLQLPFYDKPVTKIKETPELKSVFDYQKRLELLENAFAVPSTLFNGKNVLFDDLYRSGATLNAITRVLYEHGKVDHVYVLTLTKTRSKS
jgi:predicted amidophosphoribosyltransferase